LMVLLQYLWKIQRIDFIEELLAGLRNSKSPVRV
jgi:hypothetical protein